MLEENSSLVSIKAWRDNKARNNKFNKSTSRSDENYGKTRLRQTCMDSKRKILKHMIGNIKKTTIKLK